MDFDFSLDPFLNLEVELANAGSADAVAAGVREPTAMSLATASSDGLPSVRAVLFKGLVRGGLSFYTNYESTKAQQLKQNPRAMVLFYWAPLFRQVRAQGEVLKLTREESVAYFNSRPRLSQIGAWASEQSHEIESYQKLADRVQFFEQKFAGQDVPCPEHWGGYILVPSEFEFWIGRHGRLHERYVYTRKNQSEPWRRFMRSP